MDNERAGLGRGPWPRVFVGGELERAEREWLHTNGAGAYAMSTVAAMHTRRQHGLFVAALDPPIDRQVILSHLDTSVEVGRKTYRLSTHQFPKIAPTPGYRMLHVFAQDPLPRWVFRFAEGELERTLCLVRGRNAAIVRDVWRGIPRKARLWMKPLMPLRPTHELMREHGAMVHGVTIRRGEVEIQPMAHIPPVTFLHDGVFVGSPDWWRRFEYHGDRAAGLEHAEDLWTPGTFELILEPDVPRYLLMSAGERVDEPPERLVEEAKAHLLALDPGPEWSMTVRTLHIASDAYCVTAGTRPSVIAGYPWLDVRSRDTLVALPGLLLARGCTEQARKVFETLLSVQHNGLLPERLPRTKGAKRSQLLPDATLWLFQAAREYANVVGDTDPFVQKRLYPALLRAFARLNRGWRGGAWLSEEGLLVTQADHAPLTWMDARVHTRPVTPRHGAAIEVQALWARGAEILAEFALGRGDTRIELEARLAAEQARAAFRERFWCAQTDYPYDCVSERREGPGAWSDGSVRPNALIALDVDPSLFEGWQARAIVERARDLLLTPRGIRSLSVRDTRYRGYYEGRQEDREAAYHQGSAWAWLLGTFVRVALRALPEDEALRTQLARYCDCILEESLVVGHVSQLCDGEAPHRWRGTPAEAWSAAELLRALVFDLHGA